jgi:hypothetical protein
MTTELQQRVVEERVLERWRSLPPGLVAGLARPQLPPIGEVRPNCTMEQLEQQRDEARRCVDLFLPTTIATSLPLVPVPIRHRESDEDELREWVFASCGPHACLSLLDADADTDDRDDDDEDAHAAGKRTARSAGADKLALFNWLAPIMLWMHKTQATDISGFDKAAKVATSTFSHVARRLQQAGRALNATNRRGGSATASHDHSGRKSEPAPRMELELTAAVLIEALAIFSSTFRERERESVLPDDGASDDVVALLCGGLSGEMYATTPEGVPMTDNAAQLKQVRLNFISSLSCCRLKYNYINDRQER